MSRATTEPTSLETWPGEPDGNGDGFGASPLPPARSRRNTSVNTAKTAVRMREYLQYRELFNNLTLRELRSKYKRSVIGWGWSMINPLANMAIYTIVFSFLFGISAPLGLPSGLDSYALMYLAGMLPWTLFQSSIMESMSGLLGNQNLIQKTYFPRELIPAAMVASKVVGHLIEMSLLVVAIVAFGNWRALIFLPGVIILIALVTLFALGLALLFSVGNVFYRDIQHFSNILFFIWMFLTPVAYPYYLVGGGLSGDPLKGGIIRGPKLVHLLGHTLNLGGLFKLNPMTDAVLTFQSFLYSGSLPSTVHKVVFPASAPGQVRTYAYVPSNVSWGDFAYFVVWAVAAFVVGLWVFRRYEARLPEEL